VATSEVLLLRRNSENFKSQAHHWYKEKIYKIDDDLLSFDGPKEFGLSGIMVDLDVDRGIGRVSGMNQIH
jgi:hypothetical protein